MSKDIYNNTLKHILHGNISQAVLHYNNNGAVIFKANDNETIDTFGVGMYSQLFYITITIGTP